MSDVGSWHKLTDLLALLHLPLMEDEQSKAENARSMIGAQLPILSPEDDEKLLRDAGFHGINLFYVGFTFRGWVAYA